jgi:hypothetical protein
VEGTARLDLTFAIDASILKPPFHLRLIDSAAIM